MAPGKVVVDVGTGRDAVWAVLAARAGARHVYAVEADPIAAGQARDVVRGMGLGPRITFVEGDARRVRLPERAGVCVSEIVGNVASAEGDAGGVVGRAAAALRAGLRLGAVPNADLDGGGGPHPGRAA